MFQYVCGLSIKNRRKIFFKPSTNRALQRSEFNLVCNGAIIHQNDMIKYDVGITNQLN